MARQKNDGRGRIGGRAKGTPNKTTSSLRNWVRLFVTRNTKQMQSNFDALDPKEQWDVLVKLLQYIIPKQQAVAAAATVDLNALTDDQINQVVEQIAANVMGDGNSSQ